ncbi:sensor histidine kinase [Hyphomonas johnsonii]|uniref:histidine kinase n=1 Tax=Hyphomonas johnsonii MHS-2 TaxID=1280950 RepID=A0A059FTT3_9PROT|nr:sensor histidine kinase [Hyphomonas johnsonii]KCZ93926.1 signal transduction histidine kinase [Hyphomonas johnsonii MHS-2]
MTDSTPHTSRLALEQRLRESEAIFESTFQNAAIGIAHVGLDGSWLRVNETLCRVVGHPREDLLAMTFQDITHPDDLEADLGLVDKVLAGEIAHYAMDKRFQRADGTYRWTRLTVASKRDLSGKPEFFISMVEDIDDRKRAEARNAVLQQELVHRSRNLLTIIASLTSLLAPSCSTVSEFEGRLLGRIQAMSRANDLLIAGNWKGAPLREVVTSHLNGLLGDRASDVTVEGADFVVNAGGVQCFSLALYELTSNALKYGAFHAPGGSVSIRWDAGGPDTPFRFEWSEHCAGPVTPPETTGFGTTVLSTMAPMAVRGAAETFYRPHGVDWVLTAPSANVLPAPAA